jgi:NCS1 nucleoside transporter family
MSVSLAETAADRHYGAKVNAVEPGGAEVIPLAERHGKPLQLLWTWTSPNMEFATIVVGMLGVSFGLSFWQVFAAIVIGNVAGALCQAVLASWGPSTGFCQMVLSRRAFGFLGNWLPAGLNWLVAGIGWFAVNAVSGGLALGALTGMNDYVALVIVVVIMLALAYFGHNLIQLFEKYAAPLLTVVFVVGGIVILSKAHTSTPAAGAFPGAWWVLLGATFGYAAGWNPYASDYTRYLPPGTGKAAGLFSGLGVLVSCVLLETFGAAAFVALGKNASLDPGAYTSVLPTWLGKLTLLCIALGAIAANAINVYSSAMSFSAMGIQIKTPSLRAIVAVTMGVLGFIVGAISLRHIDKYENFLLVISYWIGPWLGVVFVDRIMRRWRMDELVYDRGYKNWAGPIAMFVSAVVSIWLFSNQTFYTGPIPKAHGSIGDLTFEVGFVLAGIIYAVLVKALADPITVATPEQLSLAKR